MFKDREYTTAPLEFENNNVYTYVKFFIYLWDTLAYSENGHVLVKVKNGIKYVFAELHLKKLIIWRHQISCL